MQRFLITIVVLVGALWLFNTSLFTAFPSGGAPRVIAHRGQHQTFDRKGLDNDTCTATRIDPPRHAYLENTIPSMRAAFEAGAEVVELDVHLTPDGAFAVFHDWTLDCRTNGTGITEQMPMAALKALDIGHGYTADGGRTFPFRGQGIGLMPTLEEVFQTFPDRQFLVNFKSRRTEEGTELAARLNGNPAHRQSLFGVYGGDEPTEAAIAGVTALRGYSKSSVKSCLVGYLALGWSGYVPAACRDSLVPVPENYAFLLWGWPTKFVQRMAAAGSEVILVGPFSAGDPGTAGLDDEAAWSRIPQGFPGLVWTNRIEQARDFARQSGYCRERVPVGVCAAE